VHAQQHGADCTPTLVVVRFYSEQVLPRAIDRIMRAPRLSKLRERACAGLTGDIIEIGFGSGLNVRHYPATVTGAWVVEPSAVARRLAQPRIDRSTIPVEFAGLDGQRLDLPDARFDGALSTWVLCTIPHVDAALQELRRVLKPGGHFHFVEHGLAPDDGVRRWQHRLDGLNGRIAGGCHLVRDIPAIVRDAGFEIEALDAFYVPAPKIQGYMYLGRAVNPSR
jgi:SAM-dependent methyltransferase